MGGIGSLPDLALLGLAVAYGHINAVVLAVHLRRQRHTDAAGQALTQGAGGDVNAGALVHRGVALQGGALLAQGVQGLHREEALHRQRRILCGADVALGHHETVAVGPAGILGIDVHLMPVAGGHKFRDRQRPTRMTGLGLIDHVDHMLLEIDAFVLQLFDGELLSHTKHSFSI